MTAQSATEQRANPTPESAASPKDAAATSELPAIPNKRYFTIGEVGTLCDVKSHVLRYWEQEFSQLKPIKRRGNRRYYQRHDIELIRLIRTLLYEQGFTIAGARQQLTQVPRGAGRDGSGKTEAILDARKRIHDEQIDRQKMVLAETAGVEASAEDRPIDRSADTDETAADTPSATAQTTTQDPATAVAKSAPGITPGATPKTSQLTEVRLALEALLNELAPFRAD